MALRSLRWLAPQRISVRFSTRRGEGIWPYRSKYSIRRGVLRRRPWTQRCSDPTPLLRIPNIRLSTAHRSYRPPINRCNGFLASCALAIRHKLPFLHLPKRPILAAALPSPADCHGVTCGASSLIAEDDFLPQAISQVIRFDFSWREVAWKRTKSPLQFDNAWQRRRDRSSHSGR